MKFEKTSFKDLFVIHYSPHEDERGFFVELYNQRDFHNANLIVDFKQDNLSYSDYKTLRGLHCQKKPYEQGKLITVIDGSIFDVAVDLRTNSSTFLRYFSMELSSNKKKAIYIPPGFAHGFCVTSTTALVHYKCTSLYEPKAQLSLAFNDKDLNIKWPLMPDLEKITQKDKNGLKLEEILTFI